jgi:hypothetical protein
VPGALGSSQSLQLASIPPFHILDSITDFPHPLTVPYPSKNPVEALLILSDIVVEGKFSQINLVIISGIFQ